ncbi:MAG: tetratricopeptide repeat protein [Desulfomonilaceae bacterium]
MNFKTYPLQSTGERGKMVVTPKIIRRLLVMVFCCLAGLASASNAADYFTQGCAASMSRQWDSSIEFFNKAIEINPENTAAYIQRATSFQMVNRIDDAIKDYETALKLKPDYYLAFEYLAHLYELKNEPAKALEIYNRALPLVKDPKWRSIITWKMAQAKKKLASQRVKQ